VKEKINALVVEDHYINQELMKEMLDRLNCTVDTAENGQEALKKVKTNDYDIIFMDLQMPQMDGLEATKKVRGLLGDKKKTSIIAITANALEGDEKKCLDAGMDGYLSKPFEIKDIENLLEKIFGSRGNR